MEVKKNNPKAIQDAIESVRKSSWENKDVMVKALEEQLEEFEIEKSFVPDSDIEKEYNTARDLITKASMPADQKEKQLDAIDEIYGYQIEQHDIRKANLIEVIKSEEPVARVLKVASKSYQSGLISAEDAHKMMSDAILTDSRLTSK